MITLFTPRHYLVEEISLDAIEETVEQLSLYEEDIFYFFEDDSFEELDFEHEESNRFIE